MTINHFKYYGVLITTGFVLLLSIEHISDVLKLVEAYDYKGSGTWLAGAGFQFFEIVIGVAIADLIIRKVKSWSVIITLSIIVFIFFVYNLASNFIYAFINMAEITSRDELRLDKLMNLDGLQIFLVFLNSIPIPLMGISGVIVSTIFKQDLKMQNENNQVPVNIKFTEVEKTNEQLQKNDDWTFVASPTTAEEFDNTDGKPKPHNPAIKPRFK